MTARVPYRPPSATREPTFVDESLFGETMSERLRKARISSTTRVTNRDLLAAAGGRALVSPPGGDHPPAGAGRVGSAGGMHASRAAAAAGAGEPSAAAPVVMRASDLDAMRTRTEASSLFDNPEREDAVLMRRVADASKTAAAAARRDRIRSLEVTRLASVPKTDLEREEEAEKERRRALAGRAKEMALDDAKAMQAMRNYAVTVAIRDRQLVEKAAAKEADAIVDKMADVATEIARLEEVKRVHEREEAAKVAARVAASDVYRQLAEREAARAAARAALRAEADETVARAVAEAEAAKRRLEDDRRRKTAALADVLASNEAALRAKAERRAAAVEEDRRIEAVQLAMLHAKLEEEARAEDARKAREEALFKVRGDVQKAYDNRSQLDELRARRAFEAAARVERAREMERVRRHAASIDDLKAERAAQMVTKMVATAREVEAEKAEFERAIAVQKVWIDDERRATDARRAADAEHRRALQRQVEEKEAAARAAREAKAREGDGARKAEEEKQRLLAKVREEALADLAGMGVPSRYGAQLHRYDPGGAIKADYKLGAAMGGAAKKDKATAAGGAGAAAGGGAKRK